MAGRNALTTWLEYTPGTRREATTAKPAASTRGTRSTIGPSPITPPRKEPVQQPPTAAVDRPPAPPRRAVHDHDEAPVGTQEAKGLVEDLPSSVGFEKVEEVSDRDDVGGPVGERRRPCVGNDEHRGDACGPQPRRRTLQHAGRPIDQRQRPERMASIEDRGREGPCSRSQVDDRSSRERLGKRGSGSQGPPLENQLKVVPARLTVEEGHDGIGRRFRAGRRKGRAAGFHLVLQGRGARRCRRSLCSDDMLNETARFSGRGTRRAIPGGVHDGIVTGAGADVAHLRTSFQNGWCAVRWLRESGRRLRG